MKKKKTEVQTRLSGHRQFSFLKPVPYSFTHSWFKLHKCSVTVEEFRAGRRACWMVTPQNVRSGHCGLQTHCSHLVHPAVWHKLPNTDWSISQSKINPLITPPSLSLKYTHFPLTGLGTNMTNVSMGSLPEVILRLGIPNVDAVWDKANVLFKFALTGNVNMNWTCHHSCVPAAQCVS